ncbi:hypothetical protein E2562_011410 [Oryza meyeriana var. granulata]|uniref:CCHC-type domain-containing protein n=1 Tax=Oryza meyeriana var. granulata TaxID=110450 RepID=A0A6G1D246_9ORYZ|nr:hypothetical protein E2562_011410 [Oryza meyeriana var. granulata]
MSSEGVYTQPSCHGNGSGNGGDGDNGGQGSRELAVQQVKEAGVTLRYPMLGENNYGVWAVKMKIFMRAQGVWAAVEGNAADEKMDQMALAAIVQAVPEAMVMAISEKETAKEAWDALKQMNMGEERVKKARVTTIVNEIRSLGTKVEETTVVEKLLHFVPDKFRSLISTIEQWGDVSEMTVTETIGRLRAFEESSKGRCRENEGKEQLLTASAEQRLTRAEWEAIVAKEKRGGEGSGNNGEKKKYRGKFDKSKIDCRKCGEFGHFADECDEVKKTVKGVAQLAMADDDDEPTLL